MRFGCFAYVACVSCSVRCVLACLRTFLASSACVASKKRVAWKLGFKILKQHCVGLEQAGDHYWDTRSPAVSWIADRTGCQWPSGLSKIADFHYIWKGVCHFLIVINSNFGRISHYFRDIASFRLKTRIFLPPFHSITNLKMFFLH